MDDPISIKLFGGIKAMLLLLRYSSVSDVRVLKSPNANVVSPLYERSLRI